MNRPLKTLGRRGDPWPTQLILIGVTYFTFVFLLFFPLVLVFASALSKGWLFYWAALNEPQTKSAIGLTLLATAIVTPLNSVFGVAVAYVLTKFDFRGKAILTALVDLPFAVSPVVAGLAYVVYLGSHSVAGSWLNEIGIKVIFSLPGIVLATLFVTVPFVARELIPLMQTQGTDEEVAALTLGARGWQIFHRITIPNIKWGLLYGIVLCNARAMGEFGAVSVVSGHIRGQTNTIPLQVEIFYDDYDFTKAFALASVLVFLTIGSLIVKFFLEKRFLNKLDNRSGGKR